MLVILVAGALLPVAAAAYPEGAPWSSMHDREGPCASCHFDSPPIENSAAISIKGVVGTARAGETYLLRVRFAPQAAVAGFLATFEGAGGDAGTVASAKDLEVNGPAVRSLAVKDVAEGSASWSFEWTAPRTPGVVRLRIAANAANDDASPFGDVIHHRTLKLQVQ